MQVLAMPPPQSLNNNSFPLFAKHVHTQSWSRETTLLTNSCSRSPGLRPAVALALPNLFVSTRASTSIFCKLYLGVLRGTNRGFEGEQQGFWWYFWYSYFDRDHVKGDRLYVMTFSYYYYQNTKEPRTPFPKTLTRNLRFQILLLCQPLFPS